MTMKSPFSIVRREGFSYDTISPSGAEELALSTNRIAQDFVDKSHGSDVISVKIENMIQAAVFCGLSADAYGLAITASCGHGRRERYWQSQQRRLKDEADCYEVANALRSKLPKP